MKRRLAFVIAAFVVTICYPARAVTLPELMEENAQSRIDLRYDRVDVSTQRRGVSMNYWPFRMQKNILSAVYPVEDHQGEGGHDPLMKALRSFLDWRPFRDSFHITWGMLKDNGLQEFVVNTGSETGLYSIRSVREDIVHITGQNSQNDILPYVGIGWRELGTLPKSVDVSLHMGLVYQKRNHLPFITQGPQVVQGWYFHDNLQQARSAQLGRQHRLFPVVSLGMKVVF